MIFGLSVSMCPLCGLLKLIKSAQRTYLTGFVSLLTYGSTLVCFYIHKGQLPFQKHWPV